MGCIRARHKPHCAAQGLVCESVLQQARLWVSVYWVSLAKNSGMLWGNSSLMFYISKRCGDLWDIVEWMSFQSLPCPPLLGAAHPPDSHSEAVLEKAFWDPGAGPAGPQPGHTGKPSDPEPCTQCWPAVWCLPSARPVSFAVDQIQGCSLLSQRDSL